MYDTILTIVIPVYNTEKYLRRCLESVINQTFRQFEIILINDCSSDNSSIILDEYAKKDNRIKLINLKENKGLSAVRNIGIQSSSGKYILHLDSDDWIEPTYINDLINMAIKNDADIVISDFYIDYDNGNKVYFSDQSSTEKVLNNYDCIKNICYGVASPAVWPKLIRKSLYISNNIFHPEGISLGEDLAVMIKLLFYAKTIVKINKSYVHYIQNVESITKNISCQKLFEIEKVIDINREFLKEKELEKLSDFLEANVLTFWIFQVPYSNNIHYLSIIKRYLKVFDKINKKFVSSNNIKFIKIFRCSFGFFLLWKLKKIKKLISSVFIRKS